MWCGLIAETDCTACCVFAAFIGRPQALHALMSSAGGIDEFAVNFRRNFSLYLLQRFLCIVYMRQYRHISTAVNLPP